MLAQGLAIAVAIGSTLLFLTAFLFPKLHRQDDFFWSAVGLFYALILWVCAGQIMGAVLLGQLASVVLLGWFAWETLRLRQAIIDPTNIPDLDKVSLVGYVQEQLKKTAAAKPKKTKQAKPKAGATTTKTTEIAATPEVETETPETQLETPIESQTVTPEVAAPELPELVESEVSVAEVAAEISTIESEAPKSTEVTELVPELTQSITPSEIPPASEPEAEAIAPTPEPAPTPTPAKKGFSFGGLFNRKETKGTKGTAKSKVDNPQSLDDIFAEEENTENISDPETSPDTDIETTSETIETIHEAIAEVEATTELETAIAPELESEPTTDPETETLSEDSPASETDEKPQATD